MGPSLSSISSILLVPSIISPVAKYFEKLNFISGLFLKDLKDFPVFFYFNRFYDNSNPSASFNFSRFGFFLLIIWKRSTWL